MRQVLVHRHPSLPPLGSNSELEAPDYSEITRSGLTYLNIPFDIKRLDGFGNDFHVSFALHRDLATRGAILVGAYLEGEQVRVLLANMIGTAIQVAKGDKVLTASFTERVSLKAVSKFEPGGPTGPLPGGASMVVKVAKPKKPRRKR